MILRHPLLGRDGAEHRCLLLLFAAHAPGRSHRLAQVDPQTEFFRSLLDDALALFSEGVETARAAGEANLEAYARALLAQLYVELGRIDDARTESEHASALAGRGLHPTYAPQALAVRAALEARDHNLDRCRATLEQAAALLPAADVRMRQVIEVTRGHLLLALAHDAVRRGDARGREIHVGALDALLERTPSRPEEARIAARVLAHARAELGDLSVDDRAPRWAVSANGHWIRTPENEEISFLRRRALSRILAALARAHRERPGAALTLDEIIDSGWRGERILPRPASKRAYTALWSLRALGLRDALVRVGDGYLLDPRCVDIEG